MKCRRNTNADPLKDHPPQPPFSVEQINGEFGRANPADYSGKWVRTDEGVTSNSDETHSDKAQRDVTGRVA
jgi:hypothetical protein